MLNIIVGGSVYADLPQLVTTAKLASAQTYVAQQLRNFFPNAGIYFAMGSHD